MAPPPLCGGHHCVSTIVFIICVIVHLASSHDARHAVTISVKENCIDGIRNVININCNSGRPTNRCQFNARSDTDSSNVIPIDGHDDNNETKMAWKSMFGSSEYKTEYNASTSRCRLVLEGVNNGSYSIWCRLHHMQDGWEYAHEILEVNGCNEKDKPIKLEISQSYKEVHHIGDDVGILCKTTPSARIDNCLFKLPNGTDLTTATLDSKSSYYYGSALSKGYCGLMIDDVQESHNGLLLCEAKYEKLEGRKSTVFIVASAPNCSELSSSNTTLSQGDVLTAKCSSGPSRPAAEMSWMLDDRILTDAVDVLEARWTWPWDYRRVQQTIKLRVKQEDHGKQLQCIIRHPALREKIEKNVTLFVRDPGKDKGGGSGKPGEKQEHTSQKHEDDRCKSAVYWLNVSLVIGILTIGCLLSICLVLHVRKKSKSKVGSKSCSPLCHDGLITSTTHDDLPMEVLNSDVKPPAAARSSHQRDINEYSEVFNNLTQNPEEETTSYSEPLDSLAEPAQVFAEPFVEYSEPLAGYQAEPTEIVAVNEYSEPLYRDDTAGHGHAGQTVLRELQETPIRNEGDSAMNRRIESSPNDIYAQVKKMQKS